MDKSMSEAKKPHPLQRAWAAGVFDAKVSFPKNGFLLRFDSVNESTMKRFHEIVGVGHLTIYDRKNNSMLRPIWVFATLSADDSRELLLFLSPFLTGKRTKQAADLIGKIERSDVWKRKHPEKAKALVVHKPKTDTSSGMDPA
jgi:hypothetical protein